MQIIRAYKFKIYPDAERKERIDRMLSLSCALYNKVIEKLRADYKKDKNLYVSTSLLYKYIRNIIIENPEFTDVAKRERTNIASKFS